MYVRQIYMYYVYYILSYISGFTILKGNFGYKTAKKFSITNVMYGLWDLVR